MSDKGPQDHSLPDDFGPDDFSNDDRAREVERARQRFASGLDASARRLSSPAGIAATPITLLICVGSSMVWLISVSQEHRIWSSPLAELMVLRIDALRFESFLLHWFFYEDLLHVAAALGAILVAGRELELRWRPARFGVFCAIVTFASAGVGLLACWIAAAVEPGTSFVVYGGAALALGCLAAASALDEDGWITRWLSRRHAIWAIILLGATGLVLVDQNQDSGHLRPLLVSQTAGLLFGLLFVWIAPVWDSVRLRRAVKLRQDEEARVVEIRRRVEELLERIKVDGMEGLSRKELRFLRNASEHYRRRHSAG